MSPIDIPACASTFLTASIGPRPMISGDRPVTAVPTDAGQRSQAQLLGLGVAHDDECGGAVIERAGVAGSDGSIGTENRLELRNRLEVVPGAGSVVFADDGAVRQGDGRDLPLEEAGVDGLLGEVLRANRQLSWSSREIPVICTTFSAVWPIAM